MFATGSEEVLMFLSLLKKDIRLVLSNPVLISLFTVLPLIIIFIFGFSMKKYTNADFGTFDDCSVLYVDKGADDNIKNKFAEVSEKISGATGADFKEIDDYDKAVEMVESSEAVGVITLNTDGFEYFRSTFNEPYGGDIIRSLFVQLTSADSDEKVYVQKTDLNISKTGAEVYYTFVGMIFAIMFMGSFVSSTYGRDISTNTLKRMRISKAGNILVLLSKVLCGFIFGIVQMAIALPIATAVFDIEWNENSLLILTVLCAVLVFSLALGSVIGIFVKNETLSYRTFCQIVLLSSYLGGGITPAYLLKRIPVINVLIKLSPVYWANESIISLYNGTVDEKTKNCLIALLVLSVVLFAINIISTSFSSGAKLQKLFPFFRKEKNA